MNIADIFAGYQYSSGSCWECALDCDMRHVVDIVIDCLESTLTDLSNWSSLGFGTGIPQVRKFDTVPVPMNTIPVTGTGRYCTVIATV